MPDFPDLSLITYYPKKGQGFRGVSRVQGWTLLTGRNQRCSNVRRTSMDTSFSQLLDQKRVAELLGISPRSMEGWRLTGDGPTYHKVGRRVRYRRSDLEAWLADRRRTSTSDPGPSAEKE
jgi:predicted DNA-binding transcriptional regulator AlpA